MMENNSPAVIQALEEQTAVIQAGFETTIALQREILQALGDGRMDDAVIGQAVSRYQQKMAVVDGGVL